MTFNHQIEVSLKNGGAEWILLHLEIQGRGSDIAERMNHYRCLIYSHYRREPAALAIITEGHRNEERYYAHSQYGIQAATG